MYGVVCSRLQTCIRQHASLSSPVGCSKREPETYGDFLQACLGADCSQILLGEHWGLNLTFPRTCGCCFASKPLPGQFTNTSHFPVKLDFPTHKGLFVWNILILKQLFVVYLKFKFTRTSCSLSGNPAWGLTFWLTSGFIAKIRAPDMPLWELTLSLSGD